MSRTTAAPAAEALPSTVKIVPEADELPQLGNRAEVVAYAAQLGIKVTERYVRQCQLDESLGSFLVAGRRHFSRADVRRWLLSTRRPIRP